MFKKKGKLNLLSILLLLIIILIAPFHHHTTASSVKTQVSDSDFDQGAFVNLKINGSGEDAELIISDLELYRWYLSKPNTSPSTRKDHAMAPIWKTDKVLLFGGLNDTGISNETWVFDFTDNNWTKMNTSSNPGSRWQHTMATIYGTDKVLLFDGSVSYSDTWIYDLSENNWTKISSKSKPSWRYGHAMASIFGTNKVLLFGGRNGYCLNDTWIFDYGNKTWTNMKPQSAPYPGAWYISTQIFGTDKVLLFGGSKSFNETWIYDLSENNWNRILSKNIPKVYAHKYTMTYIWGTDKIILFGVKNKETNTYNETWVLDYGDNTWTKINLPITPIGRFGSAAVPIFYRKRILLFGGRDDKCLNDTWILTKIEAGTYVSEPIDIGPKTTIKKIIWDAETPKGTGIIIQFKTAKNLIELILKKYQYQNGTKFTFDNKSQEIIFNEARGQRFIQYRIILISTVDHITPRVKSVKFIYNHWPNTILKGPANNELISTSKPIFKWAFNDSDSEQQTAFQAIISNEPSFNNIIYDSGVQYSSSNHWQFPKGTNYPELPDGTWYWKVKTKDNDGDWGEYSEHGKITIDTKLPELQITFPYNNEYYYDINDICGNAADRGISTGLKVVEITLQRMADNYYWDGDLWQPKLTWLSTYGLDNWQYDASSIDWGSEGQYQISARALDNANNTSPMKNNVTFTIDRNAPISSIKFPINNDLLNKLDRIKGNCEDHGSGIDRVEICIIRTFDGKFWSGDNWCEEEFWLTAEGKENWYLDTKNIIWTSGASYLIQTRGVDSLSNVEIESYGTYFTFDNEPPQKISIQINNGALVINNDSVLLSLDIGDAGFDVFQISYSFDGETWSPWEKYRPTVPIKLPPGDGNKTVYLRVKDGAGNIAEPVKVEIIKVTDSDGDEVPDEKDKFPNDPAASEDLDEDGAPDTWNPGRTEKNSTTGLKLDEFPDDPERQSKDVSNQAQDLRIYLIIIMIILMILLFDVTSVITKRKYRRFREPYLADKIIRQVRYEILNGKKLGEVEITANELKKKLRKNYKRGEISDETYSEIKQIIEYEYEKNDLINNEKVQ